MLLFELGVASAGWDCWCNPGLSSAFSIMRGMAALTCSHDTELRQTSFLPMDLGSFFSATVRSLTLRVLRTVFWPIAVEYFDLASAVGRLMLLCREMHSLSGLAHVCMQWLARNEQGRGTVVPLMRSLTWEYDGARAQRFFLKSVQDVSEVIDILELSCSNVL